MTSTEIRKRGPKRTKRKHALQFQAPLHDDQVLVFAEWCQLNNIGQRTGRRIWKSPNAPEKVRLTAKREGVTIRANREWQARS